MAKSKFYEQIKPSLVEREIESVYNQGINLYFPETIITHPYACDGFIDTKTPSGKILKLIIEYKFDELLSSKTGRAKVLIQVVFYIKQFEINGLILPNVCMVGDVNECFVIHTNALLKYLDEDVDWNVAPSTAHNVYPDFVLKIANDAEINPFVFNIDENFSFKDVAQKIIDLADNVQRYVHVTEHNVATIYDYFCRNVIKNVKKIKSHDLVGIFMGVITNGNEYYQHPTKKNILVTPLGNIDINGDGFKSFFSYFQRNYTPQEKNNLTAIADRLIEDTDRRNNGDFWTPTLFVDYAHKMISEQLGEDWKDKYVVWDNCCGSKNLTRDYKFRELYCSTLFESELKIGERYNKEAVSFQYDFLNDDLEKLPKGLIDAFEQDKPIVFFLNPPYGKATGAGGKLDSGVSDTAVKKQMQAEKLDGSEFIKQFLFRIVDIKRKYNLTNTYIAIFTKPTWLIKPQSKSFRDLFLTHFKYENGVMFQASEFADCSDLWGITFNIWGCGEQENKNEFLHNLIENKDGEIQIFTDKVLYNFDNQDVITTAQYIAKKLGKKHNENIIYAKDFKNLLFEEKEAHVYDDYICVVRNNANDIQQNNVCFINNAYPISGSGYQQLTKTNFVEGCICNTIRTIITDSWITDKDMYNMNVEIPQDFKLDSIAYAMFNNYCCSYRLNGKQLKNEFFWMSKEEIMDLANEYNMDEVYEDAKTSDERYVYKYIQEHKEEFSQEALDVLNKAIELTKKSFKYRQLFADEHPEYQLEKCWDAGFYQLKAIWKE